MWGTSFEGAEKHADDPESDATVSQVQKLKDCSVRFVLWLLIGILTSVNKRSGGGLKDV